MPSHIGQNGKQSVSKPFFQQGGVTSELEGKLTNIIENIRDKKSLGWSMVELQAMEQKINKK